MTEQVDTTTERRTDQINLSPVAADKVQSLLAQEGRDDLALRISVQPGGCSGLRYQLFFDERTLDGDVVTDFDGVSVVVDRMSVPYLNGATRSRSRASRSTTRTRPVPAPAATASTDRPTASARHESPRRWRGLSHVRGPVGCYSPSTWRFRAPASRAVASEMRISRLGTSVG
jgi:iron-sulfur cluster assembly accessory protein